MDPIFDLVKELQPPTSPSSTAARARQREALMRSIAVEEPREGKATVPRRKHRWRTPPAVAVVVGVLAVAGGGIAAAAVLTGGPTPHQAASIYNHYYPDSGAGRIAGTRPTLNSEMVLCDYQGATTLPASVRDGFVEQGFASAAPLTTPLNAQLLVDGCAQVSTTQTVPASTAAKLCVTTQSSSKTDTPAGWPVVVFGNTTCAETGDSPPPPNLLEEVNQRRNVEATIDAVPQTCPTDTQAVDWVHQQLTALDVNMEVKTMDGGARRELLPPLRAVVVAFHHRAGR